MLCQIINKSENYDITENFSDHIENISFYSLPLNKSIRINGNGNVVYDYVAWSFNPTEEIAKIGMRLLFNETFVLCFHYFLV